MNRGSATRFVMMADGNGASAMADSTPPTHRTQAAVRRLPVVVLRGRGLLVGAAVGAADAIDRVQGREQDQHRGGQEPSHALIMRWFLAAGPAGGLSAAWRPASNGRGLWESEWPSIRRGVRLTPPRWSSTGERKRVPAPWLLPDDFVVAPSVRLRVPPIPEPP